MLSYSKTSKNIFHSFRRLHERKYYNADIVFSINEQIFKGRLRDISVGGAFIFTKQTHLFWEGDLITISIPFTNGQKHLKRSGYVQWKNSTGFAVCFSN